MDEELLRDLPEEYAALADRRTVMLEVAAQLGELHTAAIGLGDALERAGLPGREWRSSEARLRLLPGSLPNITVDALITRLSEFAAGKGPDWLHGGPRDLEAFHREVAAIYAVVRRLRHLRVDLHEEPGRGARLARAMASGGVGSALDAIASVLGDFEALRPFIAPLSPHEWHDGQARPSAMSAASSAMGQSGQMKSTAGPLARAWRETMPIVPSDSHTRLRDFAPRGGAAGAGRGPVARVVQAVLALPGRIAGVRTWPQRRKELAAIAIVLVLALAGIALEVAHAHPSAAGSSNQASGPGGPATATAGLPATATVAPTRTPTLPRLALSCASECTTSAKLTIENVGASAVTWQAQAPRWLTVTPDHGSLAAGSQPATPEVIASGKHSTSGTITVIATASGRSASYSVSCP